jgi:hypothetical protein
VDDAQGGGQSCKRDLGVWSSFYNRNLGFQN